MLTTEKDSALLETRANKDALDKEQKKTEEEMNSSDEEDCSSNIVTSSKVIHEINQLNKRWVHYEKERFVKREQFLAKLKHEDEALLALSQKTIDLKVSHGTDPIQVSLHHEI
jgi:hypothetical protein